MSISMGLDFGTTNTVATLIDEHGQAQALRFVHDEEGFSAFRSVLCFWPGEDQTRTANLDAGPWAIDAFLERGGDCRFIQSFKTFAASALFTETTIYGRRYRFEDLLSAFLRRLRAHAGVDFPKRVVVGRPVRFAGTNPDEALAQARYEAALHKAGFEHINYVYEPAAAAYFFAQRLSAPAVILVADFGGGTSDFSIVRFFPAPGRAVRFEPLAHAGIAIAGDVFDYRLTDRFVSPFFGKGSYYKSWGKVLPLSSAYYTKFAKWNELSLLRHTREFRELKELARASLEPEKLEAFIAFLEADAGYALNRAVSALKIELSKSDRAELSLQAPGVDLRRHVERRQFEALISADLAQIGACVDRALADANLPASSVDKVFLTGGSSFVPAVRALFEDRFGAARIETGEQLVSIAYGLALIARDQNVDFWAP